MIRRYFHAHYFFDGGSGTVSLSTNGMLNHESVKKDLEYLYPKFKNFSICNFIEMTEQDYEEFNRKESDNE